MLQFQETLINFNSLFSFKKKFDPQKEKLKLTNI